AGHRHRGAFPEQHDLTVIADLQAASLADAAVVDDRAGELTCAVGAEIDQTAVGAHRAALLDAGLECSFLDLQLYRSTEIQADFAARAHEHLAALGLDAACILDTG